MIFLIYGLDRADTELTTIAEGPRAYVKAECLPFIGRLAYMLQVCIIFYLVIYLVWPHQYELVQPMG